MQKRVTTIVAAGAALAAGLVLYWPVLVKLVHDWAYDGNYSHGFIIPPLVAYFVWERRGRLRQTPATPAMTGLLVVLAGLGVLLIGRLGADLFLTRISLVAVLVGAIAYLRGWATVAVLKFPLAFSLLMIPIPAVIFNQIAFPLQLVASSLGASVVAAAGVPVLREGNLIVLARTTLEVAEACSGIRSLVSLLTLGIVYGYLLDDRTWVRTAVALLTIPLAVLANGLRVAGTGLAAHYWGADAAEGFLHTFSGWLVFVLAFGLLALAAHLLLRAAPPRIGAPAARAVTT